MVGSNPPGHTNCGPCYNESVDNLSWFIGLFEGEGSFRILHGTKARGLAISMTDKDVLDHVQEVFGGNIWAIAREKEHWKDAWVWVLAGLESYELAKKILPFLGKRRAIRCQEYIDIMDKRITSKQFFASRKEKIIELRSAGLSLREIGSELGVDYGYVGRVLRAESVRPHHIMVE